MSMRITMQLFGALAGVAAFCALPAVADDGVPAAKPGATVGQPLSQVLIGLSNADGFEVRGLDKVGDETVQLQNPASPVAALRRLLNGYAYTLELAPADSAEKATRKLIRVSILGRAGDVAGDPALPASSAPLASATDTGAQPAVAESDGQTGAVHPVTHMLQNLARASIPQPINAAPQGSPGQFGVVSAGSSLSSGSAGVAGSTAQNGTTTDSAAASADMAALTRTASANLSALVQSLKAACPAGSQC